MQRYCQCTALQGTSNRGIVLEQREADIFAKTQDQQDEIDVNIPR